MDLLKLALSAMIINNVILARFLGNCPFLGVSKKMGTALGMAGAVTFILTLSSLLTWALDRYVLQVLGLEYLQTLAFILVIAALVQLVELFIKKTSAALYRAMGIYLPLITTNCAVLGVAILNIRQEHGFLECLIFSLFSALGFGLALVLFAGIRERYRACRIPVPLRGTGIGLITAGLMSLAFYAFKGMV